MIALSFTCPECHAWGTLESERADLALIRRVAHALHRAQSPDCPSPDDAMRTHELGREEPAE